MCHLPGGFGGELDAGQSPAVLVLTGSSDDLLRGYRVHGTVTGEEGLGSEERVLEYCGSMQFTGGEKCTGPIVIPGPLLT